MTLKELTNKPISLGKLGGVDLGTTTAIPGFEQTEGAEKARMLQGFKEQQGKGVGKVIASIPGKVKEFVLESPAQLGAGAYLEFTGNNTFVPTTKLEKFIMGEEPVKPLSEYGSDFLQGLGVSSETSQKYGLPVGVAFLGLEMIPAGSGKTKLIKTLSKLDDVGDVIKTLKKSGYADDVIKGFTKIIAATTDVKKIETILDTIGDVQKKLLKSTRFAARVKAASTTAPEIKKGISSYYIPSVNKELINEANNFIKTNLDDAIRIAKSPMASAKSNVYAQQLIHNYQKAGRFEDAIDLVELVSQRATNQGQAIQALSLFNKLEPEGALRFTQRLIDQANAVRPGLKKLKLTENAVKDIIEKSKAIKKMAEGRKKVVATAELVGTMTDQVPSSLAKKISTIQVFAHLLNPKTAIRNIGGNTGFMIAENINQVPATLLDSALSFITKKRTIMLPSLGIQAKGLKAGFVEGVEDALKRIDTSGIATKFDLPKGKVFKGKVGGFLEKLLNVELRATDRAFYKAAYDNSIFNQMRLGKIAEATDEMIEIAHHDALYRTFQDDNLVSKLFVKLKAALNVGKEFGLGDFVLKYPRTPANLLARGIDYSPGGFVNALYEMSKPLIGRAFNQKAFVEAFSRALTGTIGLVGTGALLHRLGIITGQPTKDIDVRALERITGLGQYKINVSALKRFVMSGLNPETTGLEDNDLLISYDWFQPLAIAVSIGANLDEGRGQEGQISGILSATAEGLDTLGDQPLISGLQRVMRQQDFSGAVQEILKGIPSSFVPTIVSQVNQLIDNTQRNAYDPSIFQYALNLAKYKIPGLAQILPPTVDIYGDDLERYQGDTNNLFNVFFNPAFISRYRKTPEAQIVLDLVNATGETKHTPRVVGKTYTINGEKVKLTPNQITALQRYVGTISKELFASFAADPNFQELPPEEKINYLSNELTNILKAGKVVILGDRPEKLPQKVQMLIMMFNGINK